MVVRLSRVARGTLLLWLMCWVAAVQAAAQISVSTDRNPVPADESFQITFEAHGSVDGDPDFGPLDKDFQVLSSSESSNFQIINGDVSSSKTWTLTVLARHGGKITIPPISFGSDRSPAHTITVAGSGGATPAPGGRSVTDNSGDIYLEVEAKPLHSYVQAQILYTVRLYRAVGTRNASLTDPEASDGNAIIERIGEDKDYQTTVNGRSYGVVERSYAIFPQASGTLTIQPVRFRGEVGANPFSMFDPFGAQPRTVVRQSAPIKLDIAPVPANYVNGQWLPASRVTLTESWSEDPPKFRAGDPITRTITLSAEGLTSSQLPVFPSWIPDKFRAYPDQPQLSDKKLPTGITGTRVEKTAVIPMQPGKYVLPEIRVPWWNVDDKKVEFAVLPKRDITVLPAAAGGNGAPVPPPLPSPAAPKSAVPGTAPAPTAVPPSAGAPGMLPWQWISLALAAGWVLSIAGWLWLRRARPRRTDGASSGNASRAVRELKRACGAGDAPAAKALLLQWASLTFAQPPRSIGELAARSRPALARELQALNRALYASDKAAWNGQALWKAFEEEQRQGRAATPGSKPDSDLEPLYKL